MTSQPDRLALGPSRAVRLLPALVGLTLLAALPNNAKADPVDDLIEQGVKLRIQGQPAAALELFSRAHAMAPSARSLAQIGLAEGALHHWIDAENHISAALKGHDTPWIENHRTRDALDQALASIRKHIGGIIVVGPKDTIVTLNGRPAGVLPLDRPARVAEGTVRVEGGAPGYALTVVEVAVVGGVDVTAVLEMAPVPAPAPSAFAPVVPTASNQDGQRWKTWTGAAIVGASLAAVGTGIAWVAIDGNPSCDAPPGAVCQHVYNTKVQGWVAIGAGVAGGVVGGLLLWSSRRSTSSLDIGPGSVRLQARF